MNYLVINQMPAAGVDGIKTNLAAQSTAFRPFAVMLNENEKNGARIMAAGREGLVRLVSNIATVHINSLAREQNPAELSNKLQYDAKLEEARQELMKLYEMITETQLANSIDIMKLTDAFVANLQNSRRGNGALDLAMREVDDWNSRFANRQNDTPPTE
jgi:hypothetical protein